MDERISLLGGQITKESLTRALLAITTPMSSTLGFYTEHYAVLLLSLCQSQMIREIQISMAISRSYNLPMLEHLVFVKAYLLSHVYIPLQPITPNNLPVVSVSRTFLVREYFFL